MDQRAWEGLVLIVVFLGSAYLRVRAQRRVGAATQSFGHPARDQLLLFASGLTLAAILGATLFLLRDGRLHPIKDRMIAYPLAILAGLLLTYVCNRVLRRSNKR